MNNDLDPGFQSKDWQAVIVAILVSSALSLDIITPGGLWEDLLAGVGAYHVVLFVLNVTGSAADHVRSRGLAVLGTRATYHLYGTIRQERRTQFAALLNYADAVVHNSNVPDTLRTIALTALPAGITLDQLRVYELANIFQPNKGAIRIRQAEARYQNPALVATILASFAEEDLFYQVSYRGRVLKWKLDQEHRLSLVERPVERVPVGRIRLELRLSYIAWDIQWFEQYSSDEGSTHVLAFIWFKLTWTRFVAPVADVLDRDAQQLRTKEIHEDLPHLPLRRISIAVYPGLAQPSNDVSKQTLKLRRGSRLAILHRIRWRNITIDYVRANH